MTNGVAPLAHQSVRQKLNRVSAVKFSYVALYAPLLTAIVSGVAAVVVVDDAKRVVFLSCASTTTPRRLAHDYLQQWRANPNHDLISMKIESRIVIW